MHSDRSDCVLSICASFCFVALLVLTLQVIAA